MPMTFLLDFYTSATLLSYPHKLLYVLTVSCTPCSSTIFDKSATSHHHSLQPFILLLMAYFARPGLKRVDLPTTGLGMVLPLNLLLTLT